MALYRVVEKSNGRYIGTYTASSPDEAIAEARDDFKYTEDFEAFEVSCAQ